MSEESGAKRGAFPVSAGFAALTVLFCAIAVAVPVVVRQQEDASRRIGDVELAGRTMDDLNRLLQQEAATGRVPEERQSRTTVYAGRVWADWWGGMVCAGFPVYHAEVPGECVPSAIAVQAPFRGSVRGVHVGDTCEAAAARLGIQLDHGRRHRSWGQMDFPKAGVSWSEGRDHRIRRITLSQ